VFKPTFAALAAVASVLLVGPASAAVVLDQATIPETGHTPFSGGVGFVVGPEGLAQVFTVGVSGTLDHIALDVENWSFLGAASDLRFDLLDNSFGSILTRNIAASDLPVFGFSGFDWADTLNIDLSGAGVDVLAGENLILKVSSLTGSDSAQNWRAAFGGTIITYPDPAFSFDVPPGFPGPVSLVNKFGFRTYVDTAVVPEPGAWALMILGLGMVGAARRARRAGEFSA